jgi:polyvinyl alcohol dehydrogenase (cytochrome)
MTHTASTHTRTITIACALLCWLHAASAQQPAEHPGKAIYDRACAACHNNPEATKAPAVETLRRMRFQNLSYTLTHGKMQAQAASLSDSERISLIEYLVGHDTANDQWIAEFMCPPERKSVNTKDAAIVAGFGFDQHNHRHLTAIQSGLSTNDLRELDLAWAIAFPQATNMRSQPAILGTTMFLPVADNSRLFAIDIAGPPCLKWVYQNDVPLRTGAALGVLPKSATNKSERHVVVFSDLGVNVHMVDAVTGERIWKQNVALYPYSLLTGVPAMHDGRVYVPISAFEINLGADNAHECCKSHGAVTALDGASGKSIWTAHTMPDAKEIRDRGDGQKIWGPSGAPIWNSPAIDAKRGLLYVGTGEATSEPAHANTDAILAIDLKDGSIRWSFQAVANDIFLTGCMMRRPANANTRTNEPGNRRAPSQRPQGEQFNCPQETVSRDADFGASMMLITRADGKDLVLGGQKSGTVWALDPDTGKLIWRQDFGRGSPLGGIHWGIAFDGQRVFAPINRPGQPAGNSNDAVLKPGIHALDVSDGSVLWSFITKSDCSGDRKSRMRGCEGSIGLSGAPTVIDGAVLQGSLDGFLRAFGVNTGELLFKYDTARSFTTANGVEGNGGSIDNATIVAANGYVFVQSGYGLFGGTPGNVLLAFKPKASK